MDTTLDLAELADALGYYRYWVAEHHATPALACAAPEILLAAIAARALDRRAVPKRGEPVEFPPQARNRPA